MFDPDRASYPIVGLCMPMGGVTPEAIEGELDDRRVAVGMEGCLRGVVSNEDI